MNPSNKSVFASVDNERESIIDIGALLGVKPGMKFAVLSATSLEVRDRDSKAVSDVIDREKLRQIVVASSKIFESADRPFESGRAHQLFNNLQKSPFRQFFLVLVFLQSVHRSLQTIRCEIAERRAPQLDCPTI